MLYISSHDVRTSYISRIQIINQIHVYFSYECFSERTKLHMAFTYGRKITNNLSFKVKWVHRPRGKISGANVVELSKIFFKAIYINNLFFSFKCKK